MPLQRLIRVKPPAPIVHKRCRSFKGDGGVVIVSTALALASIPACALNAPRYTIGDCFIPVVESWEEVHQYEVLEVGKHSYYVKSLIADGSFRIVDQHNTEPVPCSTTEIVDPRLLQSS
jgi:hypothetical protein